MTASTVDFSATASDGFDTFGYAAQDNTPMRAGIIVWSNPVNLTISDLSATFSKYDLRLIG